MPHARNTAIALTLLTTAAVGCHDRNVQRGETFSDNDHPTSVGLIAQSQAAAGAKQDATLYDRHFRGDRLSGLGQAKLDLMAKGTASTEPVQVYLDMPQGQADVRRAEVVAYLASDGIPADRVQVAVGPNPHAAFASQATMEMIYKPDGTAADTGVTGGLGANGPGGTVGK